MKTTKLKIISDGTPLRTYVETEDGVRIDGITKLEWSIEARGLPVCKMEVALMGAEIDVDSATLELIVEQSRDRAKGLKTLDNVLDGEG